VVPIIASVYFFLISERAYRPSFKLIDFKVTGQIMGLGWQFFVISLSLLVIHSGNNLLISQFVDPASVSAYSLSYQLFSYVLLAYTIIITPLWSAYTEAWRKGNVVWIKQTLSRIKKIYFLFAIGCAIVVLLTPLIFRIWIGKNADVPILMAGAVAVMILLDMWIRIYDLFINGVGKIRVQVIVNVIMASVNIPLAYLFSVVCDFGAIGVVLASIISYCVSAIISPIQTKMILSGTAKGVWDK
jgi:O-antigen/teichoic acid export membrane protein